MGRSFYRYVKERYAKVTIRRDLYERLRSVADGEGLTVPSLVEKLLSMYITGNITGNSADGRRAEGRPSDITGYITGNSRGEREELCRALEKAVYLANKHPEEPEAQDVFREYERLCLG